MCFLSYFSKVIQCNVTKLSKLGGLTGPGNFSNISQTFSRCLTKRVWKVSGLTQTIFKSTRMCLKSSRFSQKIHASCDIRLRLTWNLAHSDNWSSVSDQIAEANGKAHPPSMPSDDIHLNRLKIEGQSCWAENDSTDSQLVMDYFLKRKKSECAHHPHLNLLIPAPHCSRLDLEPFDEIVMVLITM